MKKCGAIAAVLLLAALMLTACMGIGYNGSRVGSETSLAMEYTVFNGTDSQRLELKAGDVLEVEIVSWGGSLKVVIQREGADEPVYAMENVSTDSFSLDIEEEGVYEVTLTGRRARGSVDFHKREA